MTLEEWKAKYPVWTCSDKTAAVFTPNAHGSATWELYHLSDFAVSSANGVFTYLIPR